MFTWNNTWKDIEDAGVTVAVVPIGATEQHGHNLPLATDSLLVQHLAEAMAERFGAYLLPVLPFGQSEEWLAYPGSLSLSGETMKAVVADIVDSLARTGFRKILFVSVHGGNEVLWSGYLEQLSAERPGVTVANADLNRAFAEAARAAGVPEANHADECEASMLAAIRPDLVGPDPADCPCPPGGYPPGPIRQVSPSGALGEPSKGTAAKGQAIWQTLLEVAIADAAKVIED